MITVKVLDTYNNSVKWLINEIKYGTFWWTSGNGCCDCNRRLSFNREMNIYDDVDYPCTSERYYIIDIIENYNTQDNIS